jgi:hypothetical protein
MGRITLVTIMKKINIIPCIKSLTVITIPPIIESVHTRVTRLVPADLPVAVPYSHHRPVRVRHHVSIQALVHLTEHLSAIFPDKPDPGALVQPHDAAPRGDHDSPVHG